MEINNKLTYVTCIYDNLFNTEFGGRPDPVWRRYYYGIESMLKLMAPIVIFTWSYEVEKVTTYYKNFLGEERFNKQVKILPFDLQDSPLYELIKSIKTTEQGRGNDRSYDLMMAKFLFLQKITKENYFNSQYIFWIDAGLSHSALFPHKFLNKTDLDRQWTECNLFTPTVVDTTIRRSKDSILLIRCNSIGHWFPPDIINLNTRNPDNLWYIVGGYFGGRIDLMEQFCSTIISEFKEHIITNHILLLDEQLLTIHVSFNEEKYVYETFDVWVHEDSGEWAQQFIKDKKSFYKIFMEYNLI